MPNPFHHIIHFMGSPAALTSESPLNASLHDISELPLLGTSSSFKIDTPTVTVKLLPLPLLPGLNYSKSPIVSHKLLRQIQYFFYMACILYAIISLLSPVQSSSSMIDTPITKPSPATVPLFAEVSQPCSLNLSASSPCQVHPPLVPVNHFFTWVLLSCNEFIFFCYGVRYNPGEHIQKQIPLDIRIWALCYLLTVPSGNSRSFLSKSCFHCWKWATGCTLPRSLLWHATPRTMCLWQYHRLLFHSPSLV